MRDANIVKYRKLLYNIQYFCSHEKWILSRTRYNKRLTDFERGNIQGKHAAYNEVLRELHKAVEHADFDWEDMYCREEKVDDYNLIRIDSLKESLNVMMNLYGNEVNKNRNLTEWLLGEKYTNVDETSDNMTEEFEREHRWELSRNCFINKVVKHLDGMVNYKEHCQHGDVYSINDDGTLGEKIGVCSMLTGEIKK